MTTTSSTPAWFSLQASAERRVQFCLERMRFMDTDLNVLPGILVRAHGFEGDPTWAEAHDAAVKAAWALTSRLRALQAATEQRGREEAHHAAA